MKTILVLALTISVLGCGGYGSGSGSGMGGGATPEITGLMPNMSSPGQAFQLTVAGSNFTSGSVIYWGSIPKNTTFMTSGQLVAPQITAADTACANPPCTVAVYVRTSGGPYGSGVNSNSMNFTIQ